MAVGAVGIIPWQLVPREALAQVPPTAQPPKDSIRDRKEERPLFAAEYWKDQLKLGAARLEVARAQVKVAEDVIKQAEAEVAAAAAEREYRGKHLDRMVQLAKKGAIEQALVDEEQVGSREAQAAELEAEAKVAVSRASVDAAKATVREVEAQRHITRAESRLDLYSEESHRPPRAAVLRDDAEKDLTKARIHVREARLDRARAERDAARAEINRVEANLKKCAATREYRTKIVERLKQLLTRRAIEHSVFDEQEQALTQARNAERRAEEAVASARTHLKAVEPP